jgi:hypothetical protein
MKFDPDFVHDRKIKGDLDSGKLSARGARRNHDVVVAAVLLVAGIVTHAPISIEAGDSSLDRQSCVAFVIDVLTTLGLSWLLFSSRPALMRE